MAKVGIHDLKPGGKRTGTKKKSRQGKGTFTKWSSHKNSKLYKKKYRGQGK